MARKGLFFMHIPKTAGQSFTAALRPYFSPEKSLSENGVLRMEYVQSLSADQLEAAEFVYGHVGRGVGPLLMPYFHAVTVLRDPAQHIISDFQHVYRSPDTSKHGKKAQELGFTGFMRTSPGYFKSQVISMCVAYLLDLQPNRRPDYDVGIQLTKAIATLDSMTLIGASEELDDLLFQTSVLLGLPTVPEAPTVNRASAAERAIRSQLMEELQDLIQQDPWKSNFEAEQALYSFTCRRQKLQRSRIAAMRVPMPWEASMLTGRLLFHSSECALHAGSGWAAQNGGEGALPWRTDHRKCADIVAVGRLPERLRLNCTVELIGMAPEDVALLVDDTPVPAKLTALQGDGLFRLNADVPTGAYRGDGRMLLQLIQCPQREEPNQILRAGNFSLAV